MKDGAKAPLRPAVLCCMGQKRNSHRTPGSRDLRHPGPAGSRPDDQVAVPGGPAHRNDTFSLPESARRSPGQVLAVCGLLVLAVGLVFGQSVRHEFLNFDDHEYVYANPQVSRGLTVRGVAWVFTHKHGANWHPLTGLSHLLDCQLFGLNAGAHHFTNVLLHAATAVSLFLVLWRMTGGFWPSAGGGAVCRASLARGIGGLDFRAQGCPQRAVFRTDPGRLPALCAPPFFAGPLSAGRRGLCPGLDGQADAGDAAAGAAAVGLLAAGPIRTQCELPSHVSATANPNAFASANPNAFASANPNAPPLQWGGLRRRRKPFGNLLQAAPASLATGA